MYCTYQSQLMRRTKIISILLISPGVRTPMPSTWLVADIRPGSWNSRSCSRACSCRSQRSWCVCSPQPGSFWKPLKLHFYHSIQSPVICEYFTLPWFKTTLSCQHFDFLMKVAPLFDSCLNLLPRRQIPVHKVQALQVLHTRCDLSSDVDEASIAEN